MAANEGSFDWLPQPFNGKPTDDLFLSLKWLLISSLVSNSEQINLPHLDIPKYTLSPSHICKCANQTTISKNPQWRVFMVFWPKPTQPSPLLPSSLETYGYVTSGLISVIPALRWSKALKWALFSLTYRRSQIILIPTNRGEFQNRQRSSGLRSHWDGSRCGETLYGPIDLLDTAEVVEA